MSMCPLLAAQANGVPSFPPLKVNELCMCVYLDSISRDLITQP